MRAGRWKVIAGVLVVLEVFAAAAVLLIGDSDDRPSVDPSVATHQNYHQARYAAGVSGGWRQDSSDRRVGDYLESSWHYPANREAAFTIYSRLADGTASPAVAADLARVQTDKLPGYRERGLKEVELRGNPAVRWTFGLPGAIYVEYFFEECGISFVARGSTTPSLWSELSTLIHEMAPLITANCDE